MILKIGIKNENDSTVVIRTFDNISMVTEVPITDPTNK